VTVTAIPETHSYFRHEEGRAAISVKHLDKRFRSRKGGRGVHAIDDVTFDVAPGSTLGIVGESGSGKSTLARCILGLLPFDSGRVEILGTSIGGAGEAGMRALRADAQIVFQEPFESLDPRLRVGDAIAEPIKIRYGGRRGTHRERVSELLRLVALDPGLADRFPHQLSGGQQQRVNIARALATRPSLLVLDEPTSSLDVSVRSEVLSLLAQLQQNFGLTYVLISHDLATIRAMSTDIAVMYLGRIVEHGPATEVLRNADHPYTQFLLSSELSLDPHVRSRPREQRAAIPTSPPEVGCGFAPRCPLRMDECMTVVPPIVRTSATARVACHLVVQGVTGTTSAANDSKNAFA
jgi:oligopeptide/dipeptide ABC transporter ATP-binding protein